jgi:hypothetical protein
MVFCKHCGYDLPLGDFKFCPKCGNSIIFEKKEMPSNPRSNIKNQNDEKKRVKMRKRMIINGSMITFFFLIFSALALSNLNIHIEKSVKTCNLSIELSNPGLAQKCDDSHKEAVTIILALIVLVILTLVGIFIIIMGMRLKSKPANI